MISLEMLQDWLRQSEVWLKEAMLKQDGKRMAELLSYRSMLKDMVIEELQARCEARVNKAA